MNRVLFLYMAGLIALAPGSTGQQTPEARKSSIEGRVVNLATKEPVRKAWMTATNTQGGRSLGAATDAQGRFVFQRVAPGNYRIAAQREGFVAAEYGARSADRPGTMVAVEPGRRVTGIDFQLVPESAITGHVTGQEGEPLRNVTIYCFQQRRQGESLEIVPAASAVSNDLGEFRVPELAPNRYLLAAVYRPPGHFVSDPAGQRILVREHYAPSFYPGTSDPGMAVPIEVLPGQDVRGIDVTVRPEKAVRVRGRVAPAFPAAGLRASVQLLPRNSLAAGFWNARSANIKGRDNSFEIEGVFPGSYTISVEVMHDSELFGASATVEVGSADIDNLEIPLTPAMTITGSIRVDSQATATFDRFRLQVRPQGPMRMSSPEARLGSDGSVVVQRLLPGIYTVGVEGIPDGLYLKSIRLGGQDVLDPGLNLMAATASEKLTVWLGAGAGTVDGLAEDSQNNPRWATVVLVPTRSLHPSRYQVATTNQYGRFALQGIAPGEYRLFAFEDLEPGTQYGPRFLEQYEKNGVAVTVTERSRQTHTLKIIEAERRP